MSSLTEDFERLSQLLQAPGSLSASTTDPIFYFVYPPEETFELRRRLRAWEGQLATAGLTVLRISFSDLIWQTIDESGRWREWLSSEPYFSTQEVNETIQAALRDGGLLGKIEAAVGQPGLKTVIFFTDAEMLHPYFRVRILESALHDRVKVPIVIFYPGRRAGQFGLKFLDLYPEDGNYRATVVGSI